MYYNEVMRRGRPCKYTYNIQRIEEMESDGYSRAKIATELNIPKRALWEYLRINYDKNEKKKVTYTKKIKGKKEIKKNGF